MTVSNILLALSLFIIGIALRTQMRVKARGSPCTFLWGVLFLILLVISPLLLNLTVGYATGIRGDPIRDETVYVIYSVTIFITAITYYVVGTLTTFRRRPRRKPAGKERSDRDRHQVEHFIYLATGLATVLGLSIFVLGTGLSLSELVSASRFEWFKYDTVRSLLLNVGFYLLGLTTVFTFYDFKLRMPNKALSFLVYGAIVAMVLLSGGRKWLFFIVSGAVAGFFQRKKGSLPISRRMILALVLVGFFAIAWQRGRAMSWDRVDSIDALAYSFSEGIPDLLEHGDMTYFYRASLEAIRLNRDQGVIFPFGILRRIIFLPFPDTWTMGLKIEGMPFLFGYELGTATYSRRANQPPGLIGMFVLSFGWQATILALGLLTIVPIRILDNYVVHRNSVIRNTVWSTYIILIVLLMRGTTDGVYYLVFNILFTLVLLASYEVFGFVRTPKPNPTALNRSTQGLLRNNSHSKKPTVPYRGEDPSHS